MASARGCSEAFSADAARLKTISLVYPSSAIREMSSGFPSVSVPVLSNTTVSILWACSKASPDLNRIPSSAPLPVPTMIAVGTASPSAQGQAMTRTLIKMVSENSSDCPETNHAIDERRAITKIAGTKYPEMTSANFAMGAFEPCASSTSLIICASAVSAPTRVARNVKEPFLLRLAPTTGEPGTFSTGMLSPVSMASSTELLPEITQPSTGIVSPGRTKMTSPISTSSTGISFSISP